MIKEAIKEKFPQLEEYKASKDLTFIVPSDILLPLMDFLYNDSMLSFSFLVDICGVDYPNREKRFEVVYHLYSIKHNHRICIKVPVSIDEEMPSVTSIWKGADWHEREVFDLFGIRFSNHPNLKRILLPDDWESYPLRKDYPLR